MSNKEKKKGEGGGGEGAQNKHSDFVRETFSHKEVSTNLWKISSLGEKVVLSSGWERSQKLKLHAN